MVKHILSLSFEAISDKYIGSRDIGAGYSW